MNAVKVIVTGLAAILIAVCNTGDTAAPLAPPSPPAQSSNQVYSGRVTSTGYGFQSGNIVYFGLYFTFNDATRNRGYTVIDLTDHCDQKTISSVVNAAVPQRQSVFLSGHELAPYILDLRSCPAIVVKL